MTDIRNSRSAVIQKTTVLGNSLNFQEKKHDRIFINPFMHDVEKMAKKTFKIFWCSQRKIFKVCSDILKTHETVKVKGLQPGNSQ